MTNYSIITHDASPLRTHAQRRLIKRPTPNSYIECSTYMYACPVGKAGSR